MLVRFLFASILFHCDDLNTRLIPSNRLRSSTTFIKASSNMGKYVTMKYPYNKTHNIPEFTGIPPHVIIMVEMEELKYILVKQIQDIVMDLREELDRKNVRGDTYQSNGILEEVTLLHDSMMESLGGGIS